MEGLLCRWALALQEYDFIIQYRKGSQNSNADALSRCHPQTEKWAAVVAAGTDRNLLKIAQQNDPVLKEVLLALQTPDKRPAQWKQQPLARYSQLWPQLVVIDGIACQKYALGPTDEKIEVPLIPLSCQQQVLHTCHDAPSSGHQGLNKTLARLGQEAYWVGMAEDVADYCCKCIKCQQAKLPTPFHAPMNSIPIGRTWQMIAVDILEVPVSKNNNRYLMVVQDYFTKWAEAIPLQNQTAVRITEELVKLCATYGLPEIVHSDQGRAFESTILRQTLQAFGTKKTHTTPYHPQGEGMVEQFNRSPLQLLRTYVEKEEDWEQYLPLAPVCLSYCSTLIYWDITFCIDVWPTTKDASYWNTSSI